jgi:hypothetical protein
MPQKGNRSEKNSDEFQATRLECEIHMGGVEMSAPNPLLLLGARVTFNKRGTSSILLKRLPRGDQGETKGYGGTATKRGNHSRRSPMISQAELDDNDQNAQSRRGICSGPYDGNL